MRQLSLFEKADMILDMHDDCFILQEKINAALRAWNQSAAELENIKAMRAELARMSDELAALRAI